MHFMIFLKKIYEKSIPYRQNPVSERESIVRTAFDPERCENNPYKNRIILQKNIKTGFSLLTNGNLHDRMT